MLLDKTKFINIADNATDIAVGSHEAISRAWREDRCDLHKRRKLDLWWACRECAYHYLQRVPPHDLLPLCSKKDRGELRKSLYWYCPDECTKARTLGEPWFTDVIDNLMDALIDRVLRYNVKVEGADEGL